MSTQTITDPRQQRAGDDARIEWPNGTVLTGKAEELDGSLVLVVGDGTRYHLGYYADGRKVTVTRTVEPIPEPTEPWALVRFEDGFVAIGGGNHAWSKPGTAPLRHWIDVVRDHGAPVAVSLPRWSDEVEPWRAEVQASLVVLTSGLSDAGAREVVTHNLRALLAEGGEA